MRRAIQTLIVVATLAATHAVRADTVTIGASKDNTLYDDITGSVSNGAGPYLYSGIASTFNERRAVVAFDVAGSIPAGATITSAQLRLYLSNVSFQGGPSSIALHRLTADWGEGTSDAGDPGGNGTTSTTNDATWIHRFYNTVFWATTGGDYASTASASSIAGLPLGSKTWTSTPAMVADVQGWLNTPGQNFGWILVNNDLTSHSAKRFDTREYIITPETPGGHPELIVEFTPPVPAVSGWGMVVLSGLVVAAGMVVVKRRRQAMA